MNTIQEIPELISKAIEKYNFVKWSNEDDCLELYADNHTLSSMRKCEGYFVESILNRLAFGSGRAWFLDFGIWTHACVEHMYTLIKKNGHCSCPELVDFGAILWNKMEIDKYHGQNKNYIKLGRFAGASKLLLDYWRMYGENRETFKVIGTELPFGREKEVYLGEITIRGIRVRCYYSGRIDIIVDDGYSLGVMDTKTTFKFSGDEITNFNPHEGMQGYVYSLREIVRRNFPDITRPANRVIINHISVGDTKDYRERFKRTPITYSLEQLNEWKQRQLASFKRLFELAVLDSQEIWNTDSCSNMFFKDCVYKSLHGVTPSSRESIRKSSYVQIDAWDHYKV